MVTLLSDILDSNQPGDLLAFFLVAPARSFSIKELAVRLHTTGPRIKSAAGKLERQSLLKSFTKNQTKFYLLNLKHPQVAKLREHCLAEQGPWPDELFGSLKKLGQLSGIFLSGLFVGRNELPVDVLLVGKVSLSKLDEFLKQAQKLTGSEINYSIMTRDEFQLRRNTFDRFIKDIFDYPHVVVLDKPKSRATQDSGETKPRKLAKKLVKRTIKKRSLKTSRPRKTNQRKR